MCAGTLIHISGHLGKTSNNNNKRCQLCVRCMIYQECFHRLLHRISSLWSLLYYTCSYPVLPLVFYFTSLLLLSYHTMSSSCLISLAIYLPASVCLSSRHGSMMFMIRIYRYTCAYFRTSLGISITTCWGVLTPLDPHVQVLEFGACGFSQLLIRVTQMKRGSPADYPEPYPSRPSYASLEFSFYKLLSAICTVHACISPCILAFSPMGDVIFL